jgi:hypothetical protein
MTGPLIDHLAFLVEDLEEARERWGRVLDYEFGPITRYRTDRWVDRTQDGAPHLSDVRVSFSVQGPPFIELMEISGAGTHGPDEGPGFHHLGFSNFADADGHLARLAALGIGHDGQSLDENGRSILWFTEKKDLNGVRLEFVAPEPQPIVTDDGEPITTGPDGGFYLPDGTRLPG